MGKRYFRPSWVMVGPTTVWLVDEVQPVAVMVSRVDGTAMTTCDWHTVPVPPLDELDPAVQRRVIADGDDLVVQEGAGRPLVRVRPDGVTAWPALGVALRTARDGVAWLSDLTTLSQREPDETAELPPLPTGLLAALNTDGTGYRLGTEQPVFGVGPTDAGLVVEFAERPRPKVQDFYPSTTCLVPWDEVAARAGDGALLQVGGHPVVSGSQLGPQVYPAPNGGQWSWLDTDPAPDEPGTLTAAGLLWAAGAPRARDRIHRHAVVTAHDSRTRAPLLRVDLGVGDILDLVDVSTDGRDEVWVVMARRRYLYRAPQDRGVEVIAIGASGEVRLVLAADTLEITDRCWATVQLSEQEITDHIRDMRAQVDYLDRDPQSEESEGRGLDYDLDDATVDVVGTWPDAALVITFGYHGRPDLRLRRRVPLFDELGRPIDHDNLVLVNLEEDLATGYVAPSSDAVDGILDT